MVTGNTLQAMTIVMPTASEAVTNMVAQAQTIEGRTQDNMVAVETTEDRNLTTNATEEGEEVVDHRTVVLTPTGATTAGEDGGTMVGILVTVAVTVATTIDDKLSVCPCVCL